MNSSLRGLNVAIVGATGMVGRTMLDILVERSHGSLRREYDHVPHKFPLTLARVDRLGSARSVGKKCVVLGKANYAKDTATFDFADTDVVLMSAGSGPSKEMVPYILATSKAVIIDNSSAWRADPKVPLIIPEVNGNMLKQSDRLIANPNCVVAMLALALGPIHKVWGIKRVVVSTYQSVSGGGKTMLELMHDQQENPGKYLNYPYPPDFTSFYAGNMVPKIGDELANGQTSEEQKVADEIQKIISHDIAVSSTCVRVPVEVGHSASVNIELETFAQPNSLQALLAGSPGLEHHPLATPRAYENKDMCAFSRLRIDPSLPFGLGFNFWMVGNNLRKGAALNAVQIAEYRQQQGWFNT